MTMFSYFPRNVIFFPGSLLLVLVIASLFWCGDTDCFTAGSDESCGSLACALLKSQTPPGGQKANTSGGSECACVCHVPITISHGTDGTASICVDTLPVSIAILPLSTPENLVFHPPIAA